jgi:hypothetical protein
MVQYKERFDPVPFAELSTTRWLSD